MNRKLIQNSDKLCQLIERLPGSELQTEVSVLAASVNAGIKTAEDAANSLSCEFHKLIAQCKCLTDNELRAVMGLERLRKVYIKGYEARGAGGKAIVKFTNSQGMTPTSHVSLVFPRKRPGNAPSVPYEIESIQGQGVIHHKFDPKAGKGQLYEVTVTESEYAKIYAFAHGCIGAKYDWPGIKGILIRARRQDPSKWFCSELVVAAFGEGGHPIIDKPAWKCSPYDVVSIREVKPCLVPEVW